MTLRLSILGLLIFFIQLGYAQDPIHYQVKLDKIQHHEVDIIIDFPSLPQKALVVHMPTASPGRYAIHSFAKNVYNVKATDGEGKPLAVHKKTIDEWEVAGHDGHVRFSYTLFANRAGGTYTGIDNRKVHMNMPATFAYGKEMPRRPVELEFDLSQHPDWTVATQLKKLANDKFYAPNYYYFFDSPTIVGDIQYRRFKSTSNGKAYTIEVAMDHEGTEAELDQYTDWVQKVVEKQKAIYGELPDFDYDRYTFLCMYNPWVSGDGMEHRNSTVCSSTGNLKENATRLIGTISHEFFHAWNVERIRPQSLEPFDFDKANISGELWFAEGFTSYYTKLVLARAGIISAEDYVQGLAGAINYITNSPARNYRNPIQMSQHAPFVDAAKSIDPTNYGNTFISYYSYGSYLGLALDLTLRSKFDDVDLDDLMAYMWQHFGKTEIPYQIPDIEKALAAITNDKAFARSFFKNHIYDSQIPDMEKLLSNVGVQLALKNKGKAKTVRLKYEDGEAIITSNINQNHPFYSAGLNKGDKILTVNGEKLTKENKLLKELQIGKTYKLTYIQNGKKEKGSFTAQQDATLVVDLMKNANKAALERQKKWLE
jgi:predicted metalloprotease with PDZ domain